MKMKQWYYPENGLYESGEKKRNYFIDNLKFILMILVVVGHFALKLTFIEGIKYLAYFIYVFHMPCFIFVSGFLAKRMNAGGRLRVDRILSVFWMYLVFKIGNALLEYLFQKGLSFNLFKDNSAPWYLISLCIWYLFIPVLERIKTGYLITGSFLIGLMVGYINNIKDLFSLSRVFVFFPFFILGFCLTKEKLENYLNKRFRLIAAVFLTAVLSCFLLFGKYLTPVSNIIYGASPYSSAIKDLAPYGFLLRGIWYLLALLVSAAFLLLIPRSKLFFSKYGERTMQIYMTHIWCRNALLYAGFFTVLKHKPGYLSALVLLGSIALTFLLANPILKKLFDFLMATSIYRKILKRD